MALTLFDIIRGPRITEKAYRLNSVSKKLVLDIHPRANKPLVVEALKKLFNVDADKVGIVVVKGKKRRAGKFFTTGSLRKKAIVTLKGDQAIDLMSMSKIQAEMPPATEE